MNKTTNYNLNQWEAADVIKRSDFNADNAAIDAALKTNADAIAAIGTSLHIATGTYGGNGSFGSSNPRSLTFNFQPKLLIVQRKDSTDFSGSAFTMYVVRGVGGASFSDGSSQLTWSGNTVSWYGGNADAQLNASGATYTYLALG